MAFSAEPPVRFLDEAKARLGGDEPPPAPPDPKPAESAAPDADADKPAEAAPSGEPAAPEAKAPDLSQFEADDRERLKALPPEVQEAAVKVAKRLLADHTRKTQEAAKVRKSAEAFDRLMADDAEKREFFRWQQERALKGREAPEPSKPKAPRPWFEATTNEEMDRTAQDAIKEAVAPLEAEIKRLNDLLVAPTEMRQQASRAWNDAAAAEGIDVASDEFKALTEFVNQTIPDVVSLVNEQSAPAYLRLAQAAFQGKQATRSAPAQPAARAATIKSSGTGKATQAPKPWEARGGKPTMEEFFVDHAKANFNLTERDLGDLRKSGGMVLRPLS